jgi:TRAP-type C4-dicarboxylate transport system substrate-binding protein
MRGLTFGSILLAAALVAGGAFADTEIRISSWVSPKHPVNYGGYEPFIEAVEKASGGDISFRLFMGGALLSAKATMPGIRDGIADTGIVALTYHPAEFPHGQLISDLAMLSDDPVVAAAAVTEFNMLHCQPCLDELIAQSLVYTGTYSTAPYVIIGSRKIESVADLDGARIRTPGSVWDRWAADVGGVPVNLPASDMYESLERGITDLVLQPIAALRSYSLWDVARHATLLDLGTYHSMSLLGYSQYTWRDLTTEQRKLLLDNAAVALIGTSVAYVDLDREVIRESEGGKTEIIAATEALVQAKAHFVEIDLPRIAGIARDQHGIAEPEPFIAMFKSLLEKWQAIMDPLAGNTDQMIAALNAEVFDKIDPATYGM